MKLPLSNILLLLLMISCDKQGNSSKDETSQNQVKLDIQGHRGARGLMPENSIPAFMKALDLGVTTLEMDLAVTADGKLIVSHEPWMNHAICLNKVGSAISEDEERNYNIYEMTAEEVSFFDCGSIGNPNFPEQSKVSASKPPLQSVIAAVESYVKDNGSELPYFNIEIKSQPEGDNVYHPDPATFSDLVYNYVDGRLPWDKVWIQSFDFRVLQYMRKNYRDVKLVMLIENEASPADNVRELGFTPEVYSPYYKLLDQTAVDNIHEMGMKVIPWTVNKVEDMRNMIRIGVDGIITDYPDKAVQFK